MPDHVIHGNGQGAIVAQHGHAQAIPDENHVYASLLLHIGCWVVVAGQPGDGLSFGSFFE